MILSIQSWFFFFLNIQGESKNSIGLSLPWTHIINRKEDHTVPGPGVSGKSRFLTQKALPASSQPHRPPTCLASDDHGLHGQLEELVQHQVQEEHERLQAGGVEADDAELQLVLQGCLTDLVVQHADGEGHLALQGVAESEELLQMVVLGGRTAGLKGLITSRFTSGFTNTIKYKRFLMGRSSHPTF